ncbi:MAG: ATP-binding protein [Candidatus Omnitrophica bacterium]|nr:ATP-binding protein [Candidatus Omnitrophota bacterium]MDD5591723.1 ATP-binding protein [Candidatus Omnitrophota bacterium]
MKKDTFFGREFYLDALEKRITDLKDGYRQNIAIIGDELVGKTAIIFKFLNKFYDTRIITLYMEIRPESFASFARRFIGVLLYNFLANSGIPLKEDLDFLIKKSEKYIPKAVEKIKSILTPLDKTRKNNNFIELFSLCEAIHQETDKFCVVIFDEFQNLENIGAKNLYPEWSKLLILQKKTMYIIISSMKFKARAILSKNLSLLFGNFEILTVEPFDVKISEGYLEYMLKGLSIDKGLKNFLVHFTGGSPFYLELITKELSKNNISGLTDILEDLLYLPTGLLHQKFSNYLKRFLDTPFSQDYITILYLISNGHNKIKDIAHILRKQKKELALRINHLLELDTISRSGDFLKVNDRVFSFWLKFVYQEKMQSLTFDAKNQKVLFRDKIEGMIREFLANTQRPIIERMKELLRLFEDEIIQIDKKRVRLSHFREIKNLEFNGQGLREGVIGRSHDNLWIIALKNDLLTERDITDFARECKKYRHKTQRKIIIALQEIDPTTRLRALEEKIWTWDLNNLNQILDLFYKPRIIA